MNLMTWFATVSFWLVESCSANSIKSLRGITVYLEMDS